MPIELKYSASAGALAAAGVAAGKNKYEQQAMQTFMPVVRQQMQQRWDQQAQQQQQLYGMQRMQEADRLDRQRQERQFEQQQQMAEFGAQQRYDLQGREFEQQTKRDNALLDRQKELEEIRIKGRQEQLTAAGLASGKLRYTPEQKREMEKIDNTIGMIQSNPWQWGLRSQEEVDRYVGQLQAKRNQIRPLPVNPDDRPQPLPDMLRGRIANYDKYANLPWIIGKGGEPQLPRGWKPEESQKQKTDKSDLSSPINYQAAYQKAWTHLINARKLSQKPESLDSIREPSTTEIHDQLRQWGFNVGPDRERQAIRSELESFDSRAKSAGGYAKLSPEDQARYKDLAKRWGQVQQAPQSPQTANALQAPVQSAPPPPPPSPDRLGEDSGNYMTPEEEAQYRAGQQAIRNPQMLAANPSSANDGGWEASPASSNRWMADLMRQRAKELADRGDTEGEKWALGMAAKHERFAAGTMSPDLEIQMLQREIDQIDSGRDPLGNERRYHGSSREELRERIEELRREQAGIVVPGDYVRLN